MALAQQTADVGARRQSRPAVIQLLLGPLFFLICFGLGHPTLNRYDARALNDSLVYYQVVQGIPTAHYPHNIPFQESRKLVPYVARPFYLLAKGRVGSWDPVFFGLLVANSLFCGATAWMIAYLGRRYVADDGVALLAALLYLLNFDIVNTQLVGMVDSAESFFLIALAAALFANRFYLLLPIGLLGAAAKDTFVPMAVVFAAAWWIADDAPRRRISRWLWIGGMGLVGVATVMFLQSREAGFTVWPWSYAAHQRRDRNMLAALIDCVVNHGFVLVFAWLLPLGVWRLNRLPRPWVAASVAAALAALLLGAWNDGGVGVVRPLFEATGPVLALSAALLLVPARHRTTKIVPARELG